MSSVSLKDISIADLASKRKGLGVVKSGTGKGEFKDPFELGVAYMVEFTDTLVVEHKTKGTPQLQLTMDIINADGTLIKGGKTWVDLPVCTGEMTAEEEAAYLTKAGERFLKFLRAIDPGQFNVFMDINKDDPGKWVYLDAEGEEMDAKTRKAKAEAIDQAVVDLADAVVAGNVDFNGCRCMVTKVANQNNPKYPFVNFSAI